VMSCPAAVDGAGPARSVRDARRRLDQRPAAEARPVPKLRPARLREESRRLEEEHQVHCRTNEAYEAYRVRGVMEDRRRSSAWWRCFSTPSSSPFAPTGQGRSPARLGIPRRRRARVALGDAGDARLLRGLTGARPRPDRPRPRRGMLLSRTAPRMIEAIEQCGRNCPGSGCEAEATGFMPVGQ
jgi:hypothetical protein